MIPPVVLGNTLPSDDISNMFDGIVSRTRCNSGVILTLNYIYQRSFTNKLKQMYVSEFVAFPSGVSPLPLCRKVLAVVAHLLRSTVTAENCVRGNSKPTTLFSRRPSSSS
ncbi:hypothetical protein V1477_007954 [Vespula maculifrons]|uniref:Uncharacterized protein n=1 Tax=Vespula maculifrons TaxID=7453 RepID=A0ABD2CF49_VESMC